MRRMATSMLLVALLTGCATGTANERVVFEKAGVTDAELKRDRSECFSRAVDASGSGFFPVDRQAYRICMEQRGYKARATTE